MSDPFLDFLRDAQLRCEQNLARLLVRASGAHPVSAPALNRLFEASKYTLNSGGKRIRPVLTYAAAAAIDASANPEAMDYVACAVEMIHAYSLIHDDLPAMDNDDLRRGKPSCHKAYDEATAILAGDALQSRAFELLAETPELDPERKLQMIKLLAAAAGPRGMVGGQAIDIAATDSAMNVEQLQTMHALKTGALIRAALAMGGIASGASETQLAALDNYGIHIGLAFQIVDDILDVESDTATLGKTPGKDSEANKPTYVKLMGVAGAKAEAQRLLIEALSALGNFGDSANHLRDLARHIVERKS